MKNKEKVGSSPIGLSPRFTEEYLDAKRDEYVDELYETGEQARLEYVQHNIGPEHWDYYDDKPQKGTLYDRWFRDIKEGEFEYAIILGEKSSNWKAFLNYTQSLPSTADALLFNRCRVVTREMIFSLELNENNDHYWQNVVRIKVLRLIDAIEVENFTSL